MKKERLRDARRLALVCAGATVMALNIKSFVRVGGLYPGGFNGLTLLLQAIFSRFLGVELPFTLINLLLNSVPIVISFLFIGKKFTLFSCVTIVLSSVLTDTLPGYPLTNDPLLISVFGGIINALGISLFSGMGPDIRVSVVPVGSVTTRFVTKFESAGINQTRHEISLEATTTMRIVIPTGTDTIQVTSTIPIAESIIVGTVPESYVNVPDVDSMLNMAP